MVHTFPNGICTKVNVIARLEYELAYYDSAVNRFNHHITILVLSVLSRTKIVLIDFFMASLFLMTYQPS